MHKEISLNGDWELRDEIISCGLDRAAELSAKPDGWISAPVPGDIHQALVAAGRIKEPLLALNSFDCRWTEDRSWWYRKSFESPAGHEAADRVELELDGLDSNAEIFLNGRHLGSHRNTFRPFIADVKALLAERGNVLLVRLSAGVENVTERDIDEPDGVRAGTEAGNGRPERGDSRRVMVRKPQYSFGWDWSPRVATTAIAVGARLKVMRQARIEDVHLEPERSGAGVKLKATVSVESFHYYKTFDGSVSLTVTGGDGKPFKAEWSGLLRSGLNFIPLELSIPDAKLWWPNGYGEQNLYKIEATLSSEGVSMSLPAFSYGIRFMELETSGGVFAVKVNGVRIFSKGANWIPAETLYACTADARYETLVREAKAANFTMLRVWGGGWYEREAFYDACDRHGILLWHDFMFACAPYPDHREEFRAEVEREAEFQTKRLRRHACMALWSGSNENNWGFCDWWKERTHGGAWIYNYLLPETVRRNSPGIPYWNGSPYGGATSPNCPEAGDRHHWGDCMMSKEMEKRITPEEYDKCHSLFISEYGYVGAPVLETVKAYFDGSPIDRQGEIWRHHTNTFEKRTVDAGIRKHYKEPEQLTLDEYLLLSGLCQGLMYSYSLETFRSHANCHGALFWMYNDCWGEIGWTVIDSYLRRKPSWYFVRRALAPVRLILRPGKSAGEIVVTAANDSMKAASFTLERGFVGFDTSVFSDVEKVKVSVPPACRMELGTLKMGGRDPKSGVWYVRALDCPAILPATFRAADFRQLQVGRMLVEAEAVDSSTVEVRAKTYIHAAHLELPAGCVPEDDYLDLLPGETRRIKVSGGVLKKGAVKVSTIC